MIALIKGLKAIVDEPIEGALQRVYRLSCMNSGTTKREKTAQHKPRYIVLQWHITERCNWRCAHCYQEDYKTPELRFQDLFEVIEQFKDLLARLSRQKPPFRVHGIINVTGGEPFVRRDFLDLLEILSAHKKQFRFAIFTNGSFIDAVMARRLRGLDPAYVQVSLEGSKKTNDSIRGPGAFDQTISALKHLVNESISSVISFTAQRNNFHDFNEVAGLGRRLGVTRIWADRLIPWGSGSLLQDQILSPEETRDFFEVMYTAHNETVRNFCRTEISMHRALQFLIAGGRPYRCAAGDTLITIQPNGDLYPCRRMPIRVGNVMETPLVEMYFNSKFFLALRDQDRIGNGCEGCSFSRQCRGGLRCLSYALTGNPFNADPGCWHALHERKAISHKDSPPLFYAGFTRWLYE